MAAGRACARLERRVPAPATRRPLPVPCPGRAPGQGPRTSCLIHRGQPGREPPPGVHCLRSAGRTRVPRGAQRPRRAPLGGRRLGPNPGHSHPRHLGQFPVSVPRSAHVSEDPQHNGHTKTACDPPPAPTSFPLLCFAFHFHQGPQARVGPWRAEAPGRGPAQATEPLPCPPLPTDWPLQASPAALSRFQRLGWVPDRPVQLRSDRGGTG